MTGITLPADSWINHVLTPTPNLTISSGAPVVIPTDWTCCPLSAGTPVSLWLKADITDPIAGNHYRMQWSGHQYSGTRDVTGQQVMDGIRVDWTATQNLDAPQLSLRVLNDAPTMTVREIALMRADNMTAAFDIATFAQWYNL